MRQLPGRCGFEFLLCGSQELLQFCDQSPVILQRGAQLRTDLRPQPLPSRLVPPAGGLKDPLAEQKSPASGPQHLQLLSQAATVPGLDALLLFGHRGNVHFDHGPCVAQHITLQLVGQVARIQFIGLHSFVLRIQFLRMSHIALNPHLLEFALDPEPKGARLINGIHLLGLRTLLLRKTPELCPGKPLCRLGR